MTDSTTRPPRTHAALSLAADGRWTGDRESLRRQLAAIEAEAAAPDAGPPKTCPSCGWIAPIEADCSHAADCICTAADHEKCCGRYRAEVIGAAGPAVDVEGLRIAWNLHRESDPTHRCNPTLCVDDIAARLASSDPTGEPE